MKFKDAVKAHPDPNIFSPREQHQQLKEAAAIQAELKYRKYIRGVLRKSASHEELLALSQAHRRRFGLTPAFFEEVAAARRHDTLH